MEIKLLSVSSQNLPSRDEFDIFSGKVAGICYTDATFEELYREEDSLSQRRVQEFRNSINSSIFSHSPITMYISDIPKVLVILLKQEKIGKCSERGDKFHIFASEKEKLLFTKWRDIFYNKISKKQSDEQGLTFQKVNEMAEYYAKHLVSAFAPTNMIYSTNYGDYNNLIAKIDGFTKTLPANGFAGKLGETLSNFSQKLKEQPYYNKFMTEGKKTLNINASDKKIEETFGDVYSTTYKISLIGFSELQNYNVLTYLNVIDNLYFVPPVIEENIDLTKLWLEDIASVEYPMGTLTQTHEYGSLDDFIIRYTALKKQNITNELLPITEGIYKKYVHAVRIKVHPRAEELISLSIMN